ncbi:hypothetical protein DRJ22_04110 [Candidatus Woesearchaeota archaeon]|nr:MAG: hypothetical protein DRJ22_04110 [Candidatus Woesearchaeota archaeon]
MFYYSFVRFLLTQRTAILKLLKEFKVMNFKKLDFIIKNLRDSLLLRLFGFLVLQLKNQELILILI